MADTVPVWDETDSVSVSVWDETDAVPVWDETEAVAVLVFVFVYVLVRVADTETEDESEMIWVTDALSVSITEDALAVNVAEEAVADEALLTLLRVTVIDGVPVDRKVRLVITSVSDTDAASELALAAADAELALLVTTGEAVGTREVADATGVVSESTSLVVEAILDWMTEFDEAVTLGLALGLAAADVGWFVAVVVGATTSLVNGSTTLLTGKLIN